MKEGENILPYLARKNFQPATYKLLIVDILTITFVYLYIKSRLYLHDEKKRLHDIVKCCEIHFDRGLAVDWKHSDFGDLSREIMRDTDVYISTSTLKRIFGKISVDDEYLPQQATLDALIKYGRYFPSEFDMKPQELGQEELVISNRPSKVNFYKWFFIAW